MPDSWPNLCKGCRLSCGEGHRNKEYSAFGTWLQWLGSFRKEKQHVFVVNLLQFHYLTTKAQDSTESLWDCKESTILPVESQLTPVSKFSAVGADFFDTICDTWYK